MAFYIALAGVCLVVGAVGGAALAHFDQDLVAAEWLASQGVPLPASLYGP